MTDKKIFRNSPGFTLAETLLAVLIILLVSGIMATGVPTAINVYHKIVDASNAQALISTTMTELRDKLALAEKAYVPDGTNDKVLEFVSNNGKTYSLYLNDEIATKGLKGLYLEDKTPDLIQSEKDSKYLVSNPAANKNLYVTYRTVAVDDDYLYFKDLQVKKYDDSVTYVTISQYDVKLINLQKD